MSNPSQARTTKAADAPGGPSTGSMLPEPNNNLPPSDTPPLKLSEINSFTPLGVARIIVGLFSRSDGRREPPLHKNSMNTTTTHLRLVTVRVSHFCEKARWGLDLLEEDPDNPYFYTEDAHPPAFHAFQSLAVTGGTVSRTPIVVYPDGSFIAGSQNILIELCPFLYPSEIASEIKSFESEMAVRLGATIRAICYYYLLDNKYYDTYCKLACRDTSKVEMILFEKMFSKGIDKALKKAFNFGAEATQKFIQEIQTVFDEVAEKLERNGGEYIMDTPNQKYGFTAADLTFAALASPMIRPAKLTRPISVADEEYPPELLRVFKSFEATKAGQHCHRIYQIHRPVVQQGGTDEDGHVLIKSAIRDRNPLRENAPVFAMVAAAGVAALAVMCFGKKPRLGF